MNQLHFWRDNIDSNNMEDTLYIFSWAWSKELSANQIPGFLNQLYLKSNWFKHRYFFCMLGRLKEYRK